MQCEFPPQTIRALLVILATLRYFYKTSVKGFFSSSKVWKPWTLNLIEATVSQEWVPWDGWRKSNSRINCKDDPKEQGQFISGLISFSPCFSHPVGLLSISIPKKNLCFWDRANYWQKIFVKLFPLQCDSMLFLPSAPLINYYES